MDAERAELRDEIENLRHTLVSALALLVVVSGTLTVYLWAQVRHASQELTLQRPQLQATIAQYQAGGQHSIDQFVANLMEFGRTHPDFIPVLSKHGIKPAAVPPSAPSAPAAPASTPPK
jgi:hypothetical protein